MTSPNYSLSRAKMEGRDAASQFIRDRERWPMAKLPANPFVIQSGSAATDEELAERDVWQQSFNTTLQAFEALRKI